VRYLLAILLAVAMFVAMTMLGCTLVVNLQRDVPMRDLPWPFDKDDKDKDRRT
jgi:hypothetical protein